MSYAVSEDNREGGSFGHGIGQAEGLAGGDVELLHIEEPAFIALTMDRVAAGRDREVIAAFGVGFNRIGEGQTLPGGCHRRTNARVWPVTSDRRHRVKNHRGREAGPRGECFEIKQSFDLRL